MNTMSIMVETPKGSRQKFNYNLQAGNFYLKKLLPAGMAFPYDFGFIPKTQGEDGDPLDACIISELSTFPGCVIECSLIGAIKAEQVLKDGKKIRNDRFLFVPLVNTVEVIPQDISDISAKTLKELSEFFVNYNRGENKEFKTLEFLNATNAKEEIKKWKIE